LADPVYRSDVFTVKNLAGAKRIILTPEPDSSTDESWEKETPWVAATLERVLTVAPEHSVLDFGCGIGRLSKALMRGTGCAVLGVDISSTMRAQAHLYVDSENFTATSPGGLARLAGAGFRADHAFAVWVLQHCYDPEAEIVRVRDALKPGGLFCVINSKQRWVPTDKGWQQDDKNVRELLRDNFDEVATHPLAVGPMSEMLVKTSFFQVYRKPA